jgi:HSP20 family protein
MSLIKRSSLPSLLDDFFNTEKFFDTDFFKREWVPAVNIAEKDNQYEVELSVPGMKKEDIQVHLEGGVLTVSGESKSEKEDKEKKFTRREFSYSSFSRSFTLPENADENSINAKYENGILKLTIGKKTKELEQKKQITVN